jgi:UDP-4-amino-4,6-dideoxy-N-acetyl-beta-L-altrosamine N-acetyltransferase
MIGDDINFRRVCDGDAFAIRTWRNDPNVARFMYTDHQISEQEHRAWFAQIQKERSARYWIIEVAGKSVGLVNVTDLNFDRKSASWAFYLADPGIRGRGIGLYVEYCVLCCVFGHWALETLRCEVLETNPDISALHKSVGFKEAGRLPERAIKDGQPVDSIAYAIERGAWVSIHRVQLEERIRARGRTPRPLLSILESEVEAP